MKAAIRNITLAAALLAACVSCEHAKFLDLVPETQTSPENFYANLTQFRLATIGCYETMNASSAQGVSIQYGSYFNGLMGLMMAPSDEILPSRAQNNGSRMTDFLSASFTESNPTLRAFWDMCYIGINRCNSVIENAASFDDAGIAACVCEARFLRAFYYWYLAQVFGAVPIAEYQSDGMQPRASLETVYGLILADLEEARATLPEDKEAGVLGRASANKYTAEAYIGKICNYLAACKRSGTGRDFVAEQPLNDFSWVDEAAMSAKAYECLKDVVENSGYVLIDDYTNLFRETTKEDQHKECLLMVENYFNGSENSFPSSQTFTFSPASGGDVEKGQTVQLYYGYCLPSPRAFAMYSPRDPRRDWNFTSSGTGSVSAGTLKVETASDGIKYPVPYSRPRSSPFFDDDPVTNTQTYQPWDSQESSQGCVGKYRFAQLGQSFSSHNRNQHSLSIALMRMAEVKLMYAEALHFHLGDDDAARGQFYDVLLRGCKGDATLADALQTAYAKADFIEELLEARERELCFEGSRKYDLMRFNLTDRYIDSLCNEPVLDMDGVKYYGYNSWLRFDDGIAVFFQAASGNYHTGGNSLRDNWRPYKIWAPISALQIAANPNLKQNAKW